MHRPVRAPPYGQTADVVIALAAAGVGRGQGPPRRPGALKDPTSLDYTGGGDPDEYYAGSFAKLLVVAAAPPTPAPAPSAARQRSDLVAELRGAGNCKPGIARLWPRRAGTVQRHQPVRRLQQRDQASRWRSSASPARRKRGPSRAAVNVPASTSSARNGAFPQDLRRRAVLPGFGGRHGLRRGDPGGRRTPGPRGRPPGGRRPLAGPGAEASTAPSRVTASATPTAPRWPRRLSTCSTARAAPQPGRSASCASLQLALRRPGRPCAGSVRYSRADAGDRVLWPPAGGPRAGRGQPRRGRGKVGAGAQPFPAGLLRPWVTEVRAALASEVLIAAGASCVARPIFLPAAFLPAPPVDRGRAAASVSSSTPAWLGGDVRTGVREGRPRKRAGGPGRRGPSATRIATGSQASSARSTA